MIWPITRPRTRQPQGRVPTIEPSVSVLWNPATGLTNLAKGSAPTVIGSGMTQGASKAGVSYAAASITSSIAFPIASLSTAGTPFSILHVFQWDGNANRASLSIGNSGFLNIAFSGGNIIIQIAANTINALTLAMASVPPQAGGELAVALSYDGATLIGAVNGVSMGSYSSGNLGAVNSVTINPSDGIWQFGDLGPRYLTMFSTSARSAQWTLERSKSPWGIFARSSEPIFVGLGSPAITAYYPGSDISVAGWTSSSGGSLYADIDDVTLDRGDYITSPDLSTTATFGWKDSNGNPATIPAGTWSVDLDAAYFLGASGQVRLVWLDAGGSSVGATSWQTLTSTDTTYTLSITTTGASTQFRYEDGP